ncbi:hypothetical protein Lfu02_30280 [Longispora fulva]|uniref:Uncharacterized protein n=1 Tax=Longispora fulva TaxID=619741 RepID=A0A8J7GHD9_9ACTN|nr:hypothetical protein [Longispora fulva]MBG6139164.1 hypothetical protein [Longispora fulva]GIG58656.1 hypothetical protein Lfu02_30280 [Longispora fulva]
MSRPGQFPLRAAQPILDDLLVRSEVMGTDELTEFACSLGLTPPADGPGWFVVREFDPEGNDRGLHWDGPDEGEWRGDPQ